MYWFAERSLYSTGYKCLTRSFIQNWYTETNFKISNEENNKILCTSIYTLFLERLFKPATITCITIIIVTIVYSSNQWQYFNWCRRPHNHCDHYHHIHLCFKNAMDLYNAAYGLVNELMHYLLTGIYVVFVRYIV